MTTSAPTYLTARATHLTLHALHNPAVERPVLRGEPLLLVGRHPNGFVELDYGGQRWLAAAAGLELWSANQAAAAASPATAAAPAVTAPSVAPAGRPCFACGRDWGNGRACQFCRALSGLPVGVTVASPGRRLGAYVLDGYLMLFTLWIGWFVWSLVAYRHGQTPGKQCLGMRTIDVRTGRPLDWGETFLREVVFKALILFVAGLVTFGVALFVADLWLLWDKDNQELWDKPLHTLVVHDPDRLLQRITP